MSMRFRYWLYFKACALVNLIGECIMRRSRTLQYAPFGTNEPSVYGS